MGHHTVVDAEPPGNERVPGRHTGRIGTVIPVEPHPLGGDRIDRRGGGPIVPVAAQVVRTQAVDIEVEDPHSVTSPFQVLT